MDKGSVMDKRMAAGVGVTDESIHTPFTLFGRMLTILPLFPTRTICIYTL